MVVDEELKDLELETIGAVSKWSLNTSSKLQFVSPQIDKLDDDLELISQDRTGDNNFTTSERLQEKILFELKKMNVAFNLTKNYAVAILALIMILLLLLLF